MFGPRCPGAIDELDAEKVWELGITGEGIVIAGQDSGYDWQHPELLDSYRGWDGQTVDHNGNWLDAWDHQPIPFDDDNHGTHTLGVAVGNTVGMAPDAQWIGCRNMRNGPRQSGLLRGMHGVLFCALPPGRRSVS